MGDNLLVCCGLSQARNIRRLPMELFLIDFLEKRLQLFRTLGFPGIGLFENSAFRRGEKQGQGNTTGNQKDTEELLRQ